MSRYRFIHVERATYPVVVLCRVLRVSRAGYYAWAGRGVSARAGVNPWYQTTGQVNPSR